MFEGINKTMELGKTLQEQEFTFIPGTTPLNHGAFGAVPRRIQDIQKRFLNEQNGAPDLWYGKTAYIYWKESVDAAAQFFNCHPDDLVFVTNATEGVNTVLKSFAFQEGDSVLTTSFTYESVALTCKAVVSRYKSVLHWVLNIVLPIRNIDDVVQQYQTHIKEHPDIRIAVIDHISSPYGVLMPVKEIAKLCHKYNILVLVDGSHAPGQIPLDLKDLNVDFYTGNFHKWLFTPRGCAMLYVKRKHHDWVKPLVTSKWAERSLGEQFFHCGTRDHIPYICAKYALEFCNRIGGLQRMSSYTSQLSCDAQEHLMNRFKTEKLGVPRDMEAPNIKLVLLPEINQIQNELDLANIYTNIWIRTQIKTLAVQIQGRFYLRLSSSIYNYLDEYKRLGDAVIQYIAELNEPFLSKRAHTISSKL